jgi:hypothetical protein
MPKVGPLLQRRVVGESPRSLSMRCSCPALRGAVDVLPHDVSRSP